MSYTKDRDAAYDSHCSNYELCPDMKCLECFEVGYDAGAFDSAHVKAMEEALLKGRCDEVVNHEGSGMFNKHDPECRRCAALAPVNEARKEAGR